MKFELKEQSNLWKIWGDVRWYKGRSTPQVFQTVICFGNPRAEQIHDKPKNDVIFLESHSPYRMLRRSTGWGCCAQDLPLCWQNKHKPLPMDSVSCMTSITKSLTIPGGSYLPLCLSLRIWRQGLRLWTPQLPEGGGAMSPRAVEKATQKPQRSSQLSSPGGTELNHSYAVGTHP